LPPPPAIFIIAGCHASAMAPLLFATAAAFAALFAHATLGGFRR
jgi:hypothetical protein